MRVIAQAPSTAGASPVTLDLSAMTQVEGSVSGSVTAVTDSTVTLDGSKQTNSMAKATRFEGVVIPAGVRMTIDLKMVACPAYLGMAVGVGGGSNYACMGLGKNASNVAGYIRATGTATKGFGAEANTTQTSVTLEVDVDGKMCRVTGTQFNSSGSFLDDTHQLVEVDPGTDLKLVVWVFYDQTSGSGSKEFDYSGSTYILTTLDGNAVPS